MRSAIAIFLFVHGVIHLIGVAKAWRPTSAPAASPVMKPWFVRMTRWQKIDGVLVPTEGDVSWLLEEGELTYYRFRIDELQENAREPYGAAP